MAKKKQDEQKEEGEQKKLFELHGPEAKGIVASAKKYKKYQGERIIALALEKEEKKVLLELIDKAELQRMPDGKIKCIVDGMTITVTPRDELVQVSEGDE